MRLPAFALVFLLALPLGAEDHAEYTKPSAEFANDGGSYRSPLLFEDGSRVTSPEDWERRREEIRRTWTGLLGKWPKVIEGQDLRVSESIERDGFTQHKVHFRWLPEEETYGYLLVPHGLAENEKAPAVVTVYYEPETAIGLGNENRDFALHLTKRGFVTLSIGTKEATAAKTYGLYWPSIEAAEVEPLSMLGYGAACAYEALASRPEIDPDRIGIVGHSFGGKWAMFASCLYDKFACAAWSDPGIVFDTRPSVNYWEPWYLGYHPKPWRKRGVITEENPGRGLYPKLLEQGRDLHELHALMAPRPFLVSAGSEDPVHRWQALHHSIEVNRVLGQEDRVAMHNRPEHAPNPESNAVIYEFFEEWLK